MAIFLGAFCRASTALAARAALVSRCATTTFAEGFQLPPKRPPNGYIFFVKEQLTESRDLEPERPTRDLMRHIGAMWNNLSNSEKQRYKLMSEVQLKQWEMEYQAFLETQPDKEEYLRQLKTLRGERRKHLKVYRAKKQRRLTQPPRKLSAYNIYVRDQLAGATQDEIQARFTDAAQSWKALSDEEKAEYELEAKQIHDHEMEEYNNRIQAVANLPSSPAAFTPISS